MPQQTPPTGYTPQSEGRPTGYSEKGVEGPGSDIDAERDHKSSSRGERRGGAGGGKRVTGAEHTVKKL